MSKTGISSGGLVTTAAGFPGSPGTSDGVASEAKFYSPGGIALDSKGDLYAADTENETIRKVTRSGMVSTFAGLAGSFGSSDGHGSDARFGFPAGIALDPAGNLYVADYGNSTVRKITAAGWVSTFAGVPGRAGFSDGLPSAVQFDHPNGVVVDAAGNVYVADSGNSIVRKYAPLELTPPRLEFWPANPGLVLSWSSLWQQYALEQQAALDPRAPWTPVSGVPVNIGGTLFLTNSPNQPIGRFRLRKQ